MQNPDNTSYRLSDDELLEELRKRFHDKEQSLAEQRELTRQLKEVNDKLRESENLKSHFISNITNEIINPFASILGLSKHIITVEQGNSTQIRKMAGLIYREAFNLDFQLKNIFAAAEIESGELAPQISNVNIKQIIAGAIEYFKDELDSKEMTVEQSFDITDDFANNFHFKSDAEKLKLLLLNLISNAVKFGDKGSIIYINTRIEGGVLYFSVKDNGIGIAPEFHDIIFDRFTRLDNQINSVKRGHGLGLSVVKAIVLLFEGTIKVESDTDKGATFIIAIPQVTTKTNADEFATDGNEFFFGDNEIF